MQNRFDQDNACQTRLWLGTRYYVGRMPLTQQTEPRADWDAGCSLATSLSEEHLRDELCGIPHRVRIER